MLHQLREGVAMFTKGQIVNYYYDSTRTLPTNQISINNINNGKAESMSGDFGSMGPFLMQFDLETGRGLGQYEGARIEPINPPLF